MKRFAVLHLNNGAHEGPMGWTIIHHDTLDDAMDSPYGTIECILDMHASPNKKKCFIKIEDSTGKCRLLPVKVEAATAWAKSIMDSHVQAPRVDATHSGAADKDPFNGDDPFWHDYQPPCG